MLTKKESVQQTEDSLEYTIACLLSVSPQVRRFKVNANCVHILFDEISYHIFPETIAYKAKGSCQRLEKPIAKWAESDYRGGWTAVALNIAAELKRRNNPVFMLNKEQVAEVIGRYKLKCITECNSSNVNVTCKGNWIGFGFVIWYETNTVDYRCDNKIIASFDSDEFTDLADDELKFINVSINWYHRWNPVIKELLAIGNVSAVGPAFEEVIQLRKQVEELQGELERETNRRKKWEQVYEKTDTRATKLMTKNEELERKNIKLGKEVKDLDEVFEQVQTSLKRDIKVSSERIEELTEIADDYYKRLFLYQFAHEEQIRERMEFQKGVTSDN